MYVPELFPTSIRMRGAGFCNTLGRFMTILTPQITTWLFASFGIVAVLAFVVSLLLLQAIVVMFLGIETKQQPLEALSEAMIARNKAAAGSTLASERPATS
jgi:MFS transporter, putative metabolite:H+ symporter